MTGKGIWFIKLDCMIIKDAKLAAIRKETKSTDYFYIWIAFLCLAGKQKQDGSLYISDTQPYTVKTLAYYTEFSTKKIQKAISMFEKLDMITVNDGIITINKWDKYQSMQTLEDYRRNGAKRAQKFRDRKKISVPSASDENKQITQPAQINDSDPLFISDEEAQKQQETITKDLNELYLLAESIKIPMGTYAEGRIKEFYETYGKEKVIHAIKEAGENCIPKINYIEGILQERGKKRTQNGNKDHTETGSALPEIGTFETGKGKLRVIGLED